MTKLADLRKGAVGKIAELPKKVPTIVVSKVKKLPPWARVTVVVLLVGVLIGSIVITGGAIQKDMKVSAEALKWLQSAPSSAYESVPKSPSDYAKLLWQKYGFSAPVPVNNKKFLGVFTQTDDGAGNNWGECVSLVKLLSGTSNVNTKDWKSSRRVVDGGVEPGTIVATFLGPSGQYDSHAAVFMSYVADGKGAFIVVDQNWDNTNKDKGTGVVGIHAISIGVGDVTSNANTYFVVQFK